MIRFQLPGFASATLLALLAAADPALAQSGLNLSWTDCGASGTSSRTFACNTNSGSHTMVASVITGAELPQVVRVEAMLGLDLNSPVLPSWWQLGTTGCRSGALSAGFDFTGSCVDPGMGGASTTVGFQSDGLLWGLGVINVNAALPAPVSLDGSSEYYLFKLSISNERSTGGGSCQGCSVDGIIGLCEVRMFQAGGEGYISIIGPIERNFVQWQPGFFQLGFCGFTPVPTRATTWGSIKSMYR